MEALGINLGYLFVQIINFAIIFVVLRVWIYKPILGVLESRRERIAQGLEDARVAAEARENAEAEAEKILDGAQKEANQRIREAAERAEQAAKEIHAEAERDAAGVREAAQAEAEQAKQEALGELRAQLAAMAIAATQKLIGVTLDEQRQRALIDEFFSGVKGGKVLILGDEPVSGAQAAVTSAVPLTEEEKNTVRKEILGRVGEGAEVAFHVDPDILGGLVIRVGDRVLDGSVAGKLDNLRQTLQ